MKHLELSRGVIAESLQIIESLRTTIGVRR
ncbi:protein of unknown function (plasmid) [Cupriavidus taiwanensis]|uniref:Uncharacterized protein n=1 Tax=Cupriavidus taiwanensis TaxID=164546 RepID=A0A7Z7JEE9_9BURK|nr:protein of unknown function [Cupriavidus taiwanensis]SOZ11652.1 protein of unknown function [Cupriavidus taiwanensis]SOZ43007.1 protein of unknown function [Cupriavidus taiwanensis]SPC22254.1 protein of unknown function [Cupriavidus taiwanensis]SPD53756.1 protein of unknown function [Cupriavidus taiwanensis]